MSQTSPNFSRNSTEGFARIVRKNPDFIIDKRPQGEDVHEITQLVVSLLGIIVFTWEARALSDLEQSSLRALESKGGPHWNIILDEAGETNTLGELMRHLRNAAAHRRLSFSSESRELARVEIQFQDAPLSNTKPNWRASINAGDLKKFCDLVTWRLENLVG